MVFFFSLQGRCRSTRPPGVAGRQDQEGFHAAPPGVEIRKPQGKTNRCILYHFEGSKLLSNVQPMGNTFQMAS